MGYCPCCRMRVNTDRLTSGDGGLSWDFHGHSVVSTGYRGLVNLIGPLKGEALQYRINEQVVLKLVQILAEAQGDFPWLRSRISQEFGLGGRVEGPELDRPVEGIEWQDPQPAILRKPVQNAPALQRPVREPPVRDVARAFSRIGPIAPTAPPLSKRGESYMESSVTVEATKEELEELLRSLPGGKTQRANGA